MCVLVYTFHVFESSPSHCPYLEGHHGHITQLGTWREIPGLKDARSDIFVDFAAPIIFPEFQKARNGVLASFNSAVPENKFYFRV